MLERAVIAAKPAPVWPIVLVVFLGAALFTICGMRIEQLRVEREREPALEVRACDRGEVLGWDGHSFTCATLRTDSVVGDGTWQSPLSIASGSFTDDVTRFTVSSSLNATSAYLTISECGTGNETHQTCLYGMPLFDKVCSPSEPCE